MTKKIRHVLGISGGKDSAALAIYMREKYTLPIEYYFCDTGKELEETYQLIENLKAMCNIQVKELSAGENSPEDPFDHYLRLQGDFLPSPLARWCTKILKVEPFEKFVKDDYAISYVGIRGDEQREGYVSKKPNIQSIFPFRQNIWSEDVVRLVLNAQPDTLAILTELYEKHCQHPKRAEILEVVQVPLSRRFSQERKLRTLLNLSTRDFNRVVFEYLKTLKGTEKERPVSYLEEFPLAENEEVLIKKDIFKLLEDSGVGKPAYYEEIDYKVEGKTGKYARSRSGCYFCFFQQRIEWVWLYEQHPEKFQKAMEYEKEGYTWIQGEKLEDLIRPERVRQIKEEHLKRYQAAQKNPSSSRLIDIIDTSAEEGCLSCFL